MEIGGRDVVHSRIFLTLSS